MNKEKKRTNKKNLKITEREQQREWIQVWHIWYIVRTFANTPMYSYPTQQ
jgi:hypothetical protein